MSIIKYINRLKPDTTLNKFLILLNNQFTKSLGEDKVKEALNINSKQLRCLASRYPYFKRDKKNKKIKLVLSLKINDIKWIKKDINDCKSKNDYIFTLLYNHNGTLNYRQFSVMTYGLCDVTPAVYKQVKAMYHQYMNYFPSKNGGKNE